MFSDKEFRNICGCFTTGVCVVAGSLNNGSYIGITINSFSSVSLDPPLVLFCLDKKNLNFDAFSMNKHFTINILTEDQEKISNNFAMQSKDKFKNIDYDISINNSPILKNCLGTIECLMHAVHEGGDHQIIVAQVTNISCNDDAKPLVYYKGKYRHI